MTRKEKYGIGEQDFKSLREAGCVYIDKTEFIEKLITSGVQYYFLARPRRFGKSLFLSTLRYFFEGRRELFQGLHIDSIDWDWCPYPVLRLDLNMERYAESGKLMDVLEKVFREWELKYGVDVKDKNPAQRFRTIIETAHEKTGKKVVILVDEYDKPLVGNLNNDENFNRYRGELAALYSNFKSGSEHIRLVFLTGVSRFSKLNVFSDLNNIVDISLKDEFADVCGITERELLNDLRPGVEEIGEKESLSYEEVLNALKKNYDGYRFSETGSEIYNPWSLLNAMNDARIGDFWNETGLPTLLAESLKRVNADLENLFNSYCSEEELKGLDLLNPQPLALLYQTGYLTIKDYNRKIRRYRLGIPNNEVKKGFLNALLPYYVSCRRGSNKVIDDIVISFILGKPDDAMIAMQAYFAGIDFKLKIESENNFHNAFYLLMDLIGLDTTAESSTSDGSIDILIKTEDYVYIIELKYDHSAESALRQIEKKKYGRPYQTDSRKIFLIGVSFSSTTRCIESWKIVTY